MIGEIEVERVERDAIALGSLDSRTFAPSTARCSGEAEIVVDDAHEPLDLRRLDRAARDALEQPQRRLFLEERQVVPAPQVAVEPRRHRRLAAHLVGDVARAAAERRRDDRVDHARVERIARDADAAGREHASLAGPTRITDEVGRAAAEVGDDDQLVVIEPRRVARRRADRLVLEHDVVEAGLAERRRASAPTARASSSSVSAPQ